MKILIKNTSPILPVQTDGTVYEFEITGEGENHSVKLKQEVEVMYKGITYKGIVSVYSPWRPMMSRGHMTITVVNNPKFKFMFSFGRGSAYAWAERKDTGK